MNEPPLRVGIVGCGRIAEVAHVPGFARVPGVRVAALVDSDGQRARALRESVGIDAEVFTDFEAFLGSGLDAVSICTPNHLHAPMTLAAFERGLHVLCEKPIAGTLADADAMIAAAANAGRILQINQTLRYHGLYATIAKIVREGTIGRPQHVRCIRAGGTSPNKGWSPGADWFVSKEAHGGILLDIGIHMADCIRWVAGDVASVFGHVRSHMPGIDVADNVSTLMTHANGCISSLEMSWTFPAAASAFEVHGTAGKIQTVASVPGGRGARGGRAWSSPPLKRASPWSAIPRCSRRCPTATPASRKRSVAAPPRPRRANWDAMPWRFAWPSATAATAANPSPSPPPSTPTTW